MLVKLSKITHWYLTLTYKRFLMNPFLTKKRKRNSYPNKTFRTSKVYEIFLNKGWGKIWYTPSLKLFTFRTLKILWFNCFRLKRTYVLSNPSWYFVLFCSVFYCYFDFSKQHFTKDNNEKKSHGRRNETTLYLLLKTCRKFNHKWEHQTSTSLRGSFLFRGSREKSRESSTRKETRERGAGWEARSLAKGELASRLKFNSCLARYSFSSQFRSIVEP